MNTFTICGHAASGCNYPEGECLGLCACDKWEEWQGGERVYADRLQTVFTEQTGLDTHL